MSATRLALVRMSTIALVVLGLTFTMFAVTTVSPATPKAKAAISAYKGQRAVDWARTRAGSPYRYGAAGPHRFDCSGLTRWVYRKVGRWLPHSSSAQVRHTRRVTRAHVHRGDLVFFRSGSGRVYHVGIWAGRGRIWHAARPGTRVRKERLWTHRVTFGRVR